MLIQVDGLDAGYGRKRVLQGVDLAFPGGAVGLLGPNGAGKSTLIKTLLGFLPPLTGSVRMFDLPVPARAREVRGRVGYMPETESFIPGMNAVHFVSYMGQLSGLPRAASMERAHEVLQYVGLGESRYRNLETYSLGMKQRAKLAQAIVHDPAVILLDEPTNGMDPAGRLEMLELVGDLATNKGISVILCSHLLKDVETVAQEIIVLGGGRVLYKKMAVAGAVAEQAFGVRVRGAREAFIRELAGRGITALESPEGHTVAVTLAAGADPALFHVAAAAAGCVVQRIEPRTEKLEDLFQQAIGELGHAHL